MKKAKGGATISVEWGYENHSIHLTRRNWRQVIGGQELSIRGEGYWYEAEFFWDYWNFKGGMNGRLVVNYGDDGATGFEGRLSDATIEWDELNSKTSNSETTSTNSNIDETLSEPSTKQEKADPLAGLREGIIAEPNHWIYKTGYLIGGNYTRLSSNDTTEQNSKPESKKPSENPTQ